jgi:hypothetical protein
MRYFFSSCMVMLMLIACQSKKDYETVFKDPELYSATVFELNNVVMGNNFSPIVASRNYLYANVAAYEIIAAAHPEKYNSLAGQVRDLPPVPKPDAKKKINTEFAALMAFCHLGQSVTFPEGSMSVYVDSLKKLALDHGMPEEIYEQSLIYADTVSKAILAWSKKDNYAPTRSAEKYTVTDEEGRWVPTPPSYTSAMEPHWNKIRPLVLDSANSLVPPPPVPFNVKDSNSAYYKQVMDVKHAVENLTEEQKHIAEFWDDNPFKLNVIGHVMYGTKKFSPPGHWMSIVGIAAKKAKADFGSTVYAYTKTSIALFDAFIQCWNAKYLYNTVRPETAINKYFDPDWRPFLQTPPFPEYTCGHSTCSSAAAEALTSIFGDNFAYTDTTEMTFGIKSRSYTSFRHAADENNWARFYGGIHFHSSCLVSTEYGRKVGELVVNRLNMQRDKALLSGKIK